MMRAQLVDGVAPALAGSAQSPAEGVVVGVGAGQLVLQRYLRGGRGVRREPVWWHSVAPQQLGAAGLGPAHDVLRGTCPEGQFQLGQPVVLPAGLEPLSEGGPVVGQGQRQRPAGVVGQAGEVVDGDAEDLGGTDHVGPGDVDAAVLGVPDVVVGALQVVGQLAYGQFCGLPGGLEPSSQDPRGAWVDGSGSSALLGWPGSSYTSRVCSQTMCAALWTRASLNPVIEFCTVPCVGGAKVSSALPWQSADMVSRWPPASQEVAMADGDMTRTWTGGGMSGAKSRARTMQSWTAARWRSRSG